jgi:hypothetical protein
MRQHLQTLAEYNLWAHERLLNAHIATLLGAPCPELDMVYCLQQRPDL